MKFEDNLIELRKKKGLSQEQLAEKLDVTRQTISKWELGQTKPDIEKLKEIANIFNVDVNQLISNDNPKEDVKESDKNDSLKENKKKNPPNDNNRKLILYIVILLLIGSVSILCYRFVSYRIEHKDERKSIFDKILDFGDDINNRFEENFNDTINNVEANTHQVKEDINKSAFNGGFEIYTGRQYGTVLEKLISNLITSNKKNSDHQISLSFDGTNYGNDTSKINEIKNSLDAWQQYDLSFNYDENGYINELIVVHSSKGVIK